MNNLRVCNGLDGSIPTAPTKNPDDSVALALLNLTNKAIKHGVFVPRWSQLNWPQLASG